MARIARVVSPGMPRHVTQQGTDGSRHFSMMMIAASIRLQCQNGAKLTVWIYGHTFLSEYPREADAELFRKHERTGRPLVGIGDAHKIISFEFRGMFKRNALFT